MVRASLGPDSDPSNPGSVRPRLLYGTEKSGHWGHAGRPGERGGSITGGGAGGSGKVSAQVPGTKAPAADVLAITEQHIKESKLGKNIRQKVIHGHVINVMNEITGQQEEIIDESFKITLSSVPEDHIACVDSFMAVNTGPEGPNGGTHVLLGGQSHVSIMVSSSNQASTGQIRAHADTEMHEIGHSVYHAMPLADKDDWQKAGRHLIRTIEKDPWYAENRPYLVRVVRAHKDDPGLVSMEMFADLYAMHHTPLGGELVAYHLKGRSAALRRIDTYKHESVAGHNILNNPRGRGRTGEEFTDERDLDTLSEDDWIAFCKANPDFLKKWATGETASIVREAEDRDLYGTASSGYRGHAGRPGERGGSAPGAGGTPVVKGKADEPLADRGPEARGRKGDQESARIERAKRNVKIVTKDKLKQATLNEKHLTGEKTKDNEPFDVIKGEHAFEVKTIIHGENDKITMHPKSLERKFTAAKAGGLKAHTIVFDDRPGREAVYYREGLGSFRLSSMEKVPGGRDGLKKFIDVKTKGGKKK